MKSSLPKVLHPVCGVPMIFRVLRTVLKLHPSSVGIVVGHGRNEVIDKIRSEMLASRFDGSGKTDLEFIWQKVPKGSGHAVQISSHWIKKNLKADGKNRSSDLLVLCGDTPLISEKTLRNLIQCHSQNRNAATICSVNLSQPFGYGRIVRDASGNIIKIVEEKDADDEERKLNEVNAGIYCFDSGKLLSVLPKLNNKNAKKEFYLTDVVKCFHQMGEAVGSHSIPCKTDGLFLNGSTYETLGINTKADLAVAQELLQKEILKRWMNDGVTISNPTCTYVGEDVQIGPDTLLLPGTMLLGKTKIGHHCTIGPHTTIENSQLGNHVTIRSSFIYGSKIEDLVEVGPFSHLRPGTVIKKGARIGNFTEVKKSRVGEKTKVSHLSYIGDSTLGSEINVGAGMITCNFDGKNKHKTVIGSKTFIGSNVNLVAPVKIGSGTVIGAGSTITRNVPPDSLAIERSAQIVKRGWVKTKHKGD